MGKDSDDGLFGKLSDDLSRLRDRIRSLDRVLQNGNSDKVEAAIATFKSEGYFIARFDPLYVLGKPVQKGTVRVRPVVVGANGCPGRDEIRLELTYAPKAYKPQDLLSPPGMRVDNYDVKAAQHTYAEHFRDKLGLCITFKEGCFVLSRDVGFDSKSLPSEIQKFEQDVEKVKSALDADGKKKVSMKYS